MIHTNSFDKKKHYKLHLSKTPKKAKVMFSAHFFVFTNIYRIFLAHFRKRAPLRSLTLATFRKYTYNLVASLNPWGRLLFFAITQKVEML